MADFEPGKRPLGRRELSVVTSSNKNPEQLARDRIDALLSEAGWVVQDKKTLDFNAGQGIAVREYQTDIGPADYVLFLDKQCRRRH